MTLISCLIMSEAMLREAEEFSEEELKTESEEDVQSISTNQ